MLRHVSMSVLVALISIGLAREGFALDKLYLVQPRGKTTLITDAPSKLSPALTATIRANGILKGADNIGRPIISATESSLASWSSHSDLASVSEDVPLNWSPVKRLKLSYAKGTKPTLADLKNLGLSLIEDYKKGSFMLVEPLNKQIDAKLASKLQSSPNIQYVTPSFRIKAIPPTNTSAGREISKTSELPPTNDPMWPELWGIRNIKAPVAWKKIHDSTVIVAVIDTGVDYKHEDLAANMWKDRNGKHGYDFVENDDDPMDLNDHGTHCAGTVGAVGNNMLGVVGVNWKIEIMAVRWLDAGGSGEIADAIKAIDFAIDNGAKILSNSWFWTADDPDLEAAIRRANESEVLFVAAASNFAKRPGNHDGDNDMEDTFGRFPSAYPEVNIIAVAAITESEDLADFSHWGKTTVDLGAPGVLILSTVRSNRYDGTFSGTSMATPHVAGAAALVYSMQKLPMQYLAVKKLLIENARQINALDDRCVSGGTLDISFLGK